MDRSIIDVEERVLMAKALLASFRMLAKTYSTEDRFGANSDEILLCCAVFIGQAEKKPMAVSKLAQFAGIPRPTAIRKLKDMLKRNILELDSDGCYCIPISSLNCDQAKQCFNYIRRTLITLGDQLSNLDTRRVASR